MPWSVANYNTNPALNTAINGVDIAELASAAGYNDALRQIMADIASWIATQAIALPVSIPNGGTGQASAAAALATLGGLDGSFRDLVRIDKAANFTIANAERANGIVWLSGTGTATINPNATTAINDGAFYVIHVESGTLSIARGAGVTLRVNGSTVSANATVAAGGTATLIRWGIDYWTVHGVNVT